MGIIMNAAPAASVGGSMYTLIFMVLMLVVLYFIMIRPQRKKEKADEEMRKNVQIGDEIETVGGIVGIIVKVEEKTVVIETSSDRCKMRIKKWAIAQNVPQTRSAQPPPTRQRPPRKKNPERKPQKRTSR